MTLNIPAAIALSVLVASVAAAPAIAKSRTYKVQTTTNVPYGDDPLQMLDVCQPIGAQGKLPAFIVIHGGAWIGGDKSGYYTANLCNRLAQQGYVAFNINYRLVQGQDDPSIVLPNANALDTFPTPFLDAQLAVRWVRSQVAYSIDANAVCAVGFPLAHIWRPFSVR